MVRKYGTIRVAVCSRSVRPFSPSYIQPAPAAAMPASPPAEHRSTRPPIAFALASRHWQAIKREQVDRRPGVPRR